MPIPYTLISQMALAAYHLDRREHWGRGTETNDLKQFAEHQFRDLPRGMQFLDITDFTALDPVYDFFIDSRPTEFGRNGFENGVFTNENAAALVGVYDGALYLSFRGTNDNEGQEGLRGKNTPDEDHWTGLHTENKSDHFDLFSGLISGVRDYAAAHGISQIYVTGHSLGASMVEAYMKEPLTILMPFEGIDVTAVNFASPGYGSPSAENRHTTSFWVAKDPIHKASFFTDNIGDQNRIVHNIARQDELHNMKLYNDFIQFFDNEGLSLEDFRNLHGVDFDRVYAFVKGFETSQAAISRSGVGDFQIGVGNDTIKGSNGNEIMLGGAANDKLFGYGGRDYLDGGSEDDRLWGGRGTDVLYGRSGEDRLQGGGGIDYLLGGRDNDKLWGGVSGDYLYGGLGRDELSGGLGRDNLWGGRGTDYLTGGSGSDSFLFRDDGSTDWVMDWSRNDLIFVEEFVTSYSVNTGARSTTVRLYDGGEFAYRIKIDGVFSGADFEDRITRIDVNELLTDFREFDLV